jgi:hypothetical protein
MESSMSAHTVINAATGQTVLEQVSEAQFDRWYDHHCFWRKPRSVEEVNPSLRDAYMARDENTHFLLNDE